jgi:hypothetical protein
MTEMTARPDTIDELHDFDDPDWIDCWDCGGEGILDDECTCQSVADICCCLHPEPADCRTCRGRGGWPRKPEEPK